MKGVRRRRRTTKLSILKKKHESKGAILRTLKIEGFEKIVLSLGTQHAIGLVNERDITLESPWKYIPKEKILDNLELHELSSELLPLKGYMETYDEEMVLVGYKKTPDDLDIYSFCATIQAKETIEQLLKEEEKERAKSLKRKMSKVPRKWKSCGSEEDVEDSHIKNFRPLYEIAINIPFPLFDTNIKFGMRTVEQAKDGYVELLAGRFEMQSTYRKRIDLTIQTKGPLVTTSTQTYEYGVRHNIPIQYNYEYEQINLNKKSVDLIKNLLTSRMDELINAFNLNTHFKLYDNDYSNLPNQVHARRTYIARDIMQFREPIICKNKRIAIVTWHPLISGVVAVSYSRSPPTFIINAESNKNEANVTCFDDKYVLIWTYTNSVLPKLYLHTPRIVTSLDFCPYRKNILIGGCVNGQIIIWDLQDKLEKVENVEMLTERERDNRLIMENMMDWMKPAANEYYIRPTVLSAYDYSHHSHISCITWLMPNYEILKTGILRLMDDTEPESLQFLSGCAGGFVNVWDLRTEPPIGFYKGTNAKKKSYDMPPTLRENISPLAKFNLVLTPIYRIFLMSVIRPTLGRVITNISIPNQVFDYEALNPKTANDIKQTTTFKPIKPNEPVELKQYFYVTTIVGRVLTVTWSGFSHDSGLPINTECCEYSSSLLLHDGPICSFSVNPYDSELLLTVGGKVFAIWKASEIKHPIFWRRRKKRLVSGVWSLVNNTQIVIARTDAHLEIWNYTEGSSYPQIKIKFTGSQISAFYSEDIKYHVRKNTFILADFLGAVRVYRIPAQGSKVKWAQKIKAILQRKQVEEQLQVTRDYIERCKGKYLKGEEILEDLKEPGVDPEEEEIVDADVEEKPVVKPVPTVLNFQQVQMKYQQEKENFAFDVLTKKEGINLAALERSKKSLQKIIIEHNRRQNKLKEKLLNKENIFKVEKKEMFIRSQKVKSRTRITVNIADELRPLLKESYISSFREIEGDVLKYINKKKYWYHFDWLETIDRGKKRFAVIQNTYKPDLLNVDAESFLPSFIKTQLGNKSNTSK